MKSNNEIFTYENQRNVLNVLFIVFFPFQGFQYERKGNEKLLFDGHTKDGWTVLNGIVEFKVENGEIV